VGQHLKEKSIVGETMMDFLFSDYNVYFTCP